MKKGAYTAAMVVLIVTLLISGIAGCARPKPTVPGTPVVVGEAATDTPTSPPYPGPGTGTPTSTPTATTTPPTATTVLISPPSQEVLIGQSTTVDIRIEQVTNLFGAEVHLSFDPAKLEVQDASPAVAGVQIEVGTFPDPAGGRGFVAQNSADNSTGKIDYAVTLLSPAQPVSGGGVLARVAFKAIGGGTSPVAFINALLSDQTGTQIPAAAADGTITVAVGTPTPTPTGTPPTPTATPTPAPGTPTPTPTPVPGGFPYVVRWGDTLWAIALRFGTTVEAIVRANNIADPNYIWAGQTLIIPGVAPPEPVIHIVQKGETLWAIALRYGTTVQAISLANNILNPNLIYVGQRLTIPTKGVTPPGRVYIVQPGDTLWAIALRYGTTPWAIAIANNIPNPNLIFVGQRLVIP